MESKISIWRKAIISPFCLGGLVAVLFCFSSCSISGYKFNGATIDYDKIKTITIEDIPNQAPLVYPPLSQMISEELRNTFRRQTRLEEVDQSGDIVLEGAIVGYDLIPVAVQEDAFSALTKFTITVQISYFNSVDSDKSFQNRVFSASTEFDSGQIFSDVQDALAKELLGDIVKQIFNATVEDW